MLGAFTRQEPKHLYRRLDSLFGAMDYRRPLRRLLEAFLEDLFRTLGEDLRLRIGLLYAERRNRFVLLKRVGPAGGAERKDVTAELPSVALLLHHRTYIYPDPAAAVSPFRTGILPPGAAAAIVVGQPGGRHLFFFQLGEGWEHEETDFAFNTIRAALDARLMEHRIRGSVLEAAEIQRSLLVDRAPDFAGFDIACRSIPADEVGGDFFDFVSFDGDVLGVSIGDASGHGLPAALLVRDVVTGLRMGIEKDLKVIPVFTKLNRVVHRSNLTSRFVSLFYGELENNGNLLYVNAGHQPPLLFSQRGVEELSVGGTVIGPLPEVSFKRGFAHLDRGGTLVMCTDGLMERANAKGEMFGVEPVQELVRAHPQATAAELLDVIFAAVKSFGGDRLWEDDATAVVVKRAGKGA